MGRAWSFWRNKHPHSRTAQFFCFVLFYLVRLKSGLSFTLSFKPFCSNKPRRCRNPLLCSVITIVLIGGEMYSTSWTNKEDRWDSEMGKERNWVSGEYSAFMRCQSYWYVRRTPLWSAAISPFGFSLHSDSSVDSRLKGLNYNGDKRVSKCLGIW